MLFRAGDGLALCIHFGYRHAGQAFPALNVDHRVAQKQRNVVVMQALNDIAVQAAGIRHQFHTGQHFGTLKGHTAGHDQANIAAAQNDHPFAGHIAFQIDEFLSRAGGINTRAAGTRGRQRAPGTFPAAHRKDQRARFEQLNALFFADGGDEAVFVDGKNGGAAAHFNAQFLYLINIPLRVLRAGQFFLEAVKAETVMNALAKNAAHIGFPFQHQKIIHACLFSGDGSGHACGARAHNEHVHLFHLIFQFLTQHYSLSPFMACAMVPTSRRLFPPHLVIWVGSRCSSSERISSTRGLQKPP